MLLTGVVCVNMIGNQWTTCSFIVPLPFIYGPMYLLYLVYPWLFLNKLLACWHRGVGQHRSASVWGVIPQYIMWNIWREWKNRIFEGEEHSIIEFKHSFHLSLFEWTALSGLAIPSVLDFVDLCNFG